MQLLNVLDTLNIQPIMAIMDTVVTIMVVSVAPATLESPTMVTAINTNPLLNGQRICFHFLFFVHFF